MAYGTTTTGPGYGALGARLVFTLLGAAGLIVGAFMNWTGTTKGTSLTNEAFYTTNFGTAESLLMSVGFVMIVLGLLGIVGLATTSGWLVRLAGALGVAAFVLLAISVYRAPGDESIGPGAWLALLGAVVLLIAGFFGAARTVIAPQTTVVNEVNEVND